MRWFCFNVKIFKKRSEHTVIIYLHKKMERLMTCIFRGIHIQRKSKNGGGK